MKCICMTAPRILLAPLAAWKMNRVTMLADGEISSLGPIREAYDDEGNLSFVVDDVKIPNQQCNGSSTIMDAEGIAEVLGHFAIEGIDAEDVRLFHHSHAHMATFWSGTDEETIEGMRPEAGLPLVSIVTNKVGHRLGRIDWWEPVRLTLDDVPVEVMLPKFDLNDELAAIVDEQVRPFPSPAPPWPAARGWPQTDRLWWDGDGGFDLLSSPTTIVDDEVEP